jgi:hypothetical protein
MVLDTIHFIDSAAILKSINGSLVCSVKHQSPSTSRSLLQGNIAGISGFKFSEKLVPSSANFE